MSDKVLMVATVAPTIGQFNMDNIKILKDLGYEVHVACDFQDRSVWTERRIESFQEELARLGVEYFQVDFSRRPLDMKKNLKAYKQLKCLMSQNHYRFVHCHTPVASAICRVAAHRMKIPCIYTAHGFHFYKGAPFKNWLIFYPIERFLSNWTNILITINREDYSRSEKHFKAGCVEYVPGVGVDTKKFGQCDPVMYEKRKKFGITTDTVVFLSVGELNKNKNHEVVIKAIAKLKKDKIHYFIVGQGMNNEELTDLAKDLGVNLHLLGYRTDICDIYHMADIFVFPSKREGLPVALMEAMACGLPCVASRIRGNTDLIEEGKGGYLCEPDDVAGFASKMKQLLSEPKLQRQFGEHNQKTIKAFDISIINEKMKRIYEQCAKGKQST